MAAASGVWLAAGMKQARLGEGK